MYLERYNMDNKTKEIVKAYDSAHQLKRMADAMEEILRLVKADQERSRKYWPMEDKKND
jgi:phytoene/squalene synthetase